MRRRLVGALVVSTLAIASLTACHQEYDKAAQWLEKQPGVESVEDRGNPIEGFLTWDYAGDIRGHLASDATDDQLIDLADSAPAWLKNNDSNVELRFVLARGPFAFRAQNDHDANVAMVARLNGYAADSQVTGMRLLPDLTYLFGARADVADIVKRHDGDGDLLVADGEDQHTVQFRSVKECKHLSFLDDLLEDTSYDLTSDSCGPWTVEVSADQVLASVDDLRSRWLDADKPDVDIAVAANIGEDDVRHFGFEREIEFTGLDDALLGFAHSLAESSTLGDNAFRLSGNGLSMDAVDDTLCEQLAVVRNVDGFDYVPTLEIAQWGDATDRSSVDGSREKVVAYLDDLGKGCHVDGSVHLGL
jgi:hypothetical protein